MKNDPFYNLFIEKLNSWVPSSAPRATLSSKPPAMAISPAAAAMGVTPGAVSQQLRALQARTGVVLFQRFSHGMRLTPEGEQVYPGLRRAFEQITASLAQLEAINARQTITVSTEPPSPPPGWCRASVNSARRTRRWKSAWRLRHCSPTCAGERIDVAIRHGLGDYPGLDVQALMAPPLIPVASRACWRKP